MRTILLTGLALGALGLSAPVTAKESAGAVLPAAGKAGMRGAHAAPMRPMHRFSWGHRIGGRWHAGFFAPGGWSAWRRPAAGFILPSYWIQPAFYIPNYGLFGLPAPAYGYGWSRYYDDAVLTDRHGRVKDYRNGIHWDMGAADRAWRDAPPPRLPEYDVGTYDDHGVTYGGEDIEEDADYRGSWTGTWTSEDGRTFSGTYSGSYQDETGLDWHDKSPHHGAPVLLPYEGGYYSHGYGYYPAQTVTTVVVYPSTTTTTTTFIEEQVVHAAPRKVVKSKVVKRRNIKGR